jgi:hypothetical protein
MLVSRMARMMKAKDRDHQHIYLEEEFSLYPDP